jgi:hypothetical protein
MVSRIIDEVVNPLKFLKLLPEEMLALKLIILFNCGNHNNKGLEDFKFYVLI